MTIRPLLFGIYHAIRCGGQLSRRPAFEPVFMRHSSQATCTSRWTLLDALLLDTRLRPRARRMSLRPWSHLSCAVAWTLLATCSLRTSSRLRRRSTLRAAKTCCGRTAILVRIGSAVLTLSSAKVGLHLTQRVPLVLYWVRCSVKI